MNQVGFCRLLTALSVCLPMVTAHAETNSQRDRIEWKRHFGHDKFDYTYAAMALSPTGDLLVCAEAEALDDVGSSTSFWLWRINQQGEQILEMKVPKAKLLNIEISKMRSLAALEDGGILMAITTMKDKVFILNMDQTGKIRSIREIEDLESSGEILKTIPTRDKNFLHLGIKDGGAYVLKTDSEGKKIWERTFHRDQKTAYFETAILAEDGGFVLVGNFGDHRQLLMGRSFVWIVKIDASGEMKSERFFPGRLASGCRAQDGSYVIIYDNSVDKSRDIRLQALHKDLKDSWSAEVIAAAQPSIGQFKISALPETGFIVVGDKTPWLWMAVMDQLGKRIWEFINIPEKPPAFAGVCFDLISSPEGVYICCRVYSENDKQQVNGKIGLIKLRP